MKNSNQIIKSQSEMKSKGLFRGVYQSCALCDSDSSNLTLVEHFDTEFYLCQDHLYLYLKLTKADHYFSPVSCTYG